MSRQAVKRYSISASKIASLVMHGLMERQAICCPNCYFTGYEADILVVDNRNHKLIDIEIKVDRSDLKADYTKDKWGVHDWRNKTRVIRRFAPKIWKHYYVMPAKVWKDEFYADIPETSGVILVNSISTGDTASISLIRRAKTNPEAKPLTPEKILDIARLANLRYLKELTSMRTERKLGKLKIRGDLIRGVAGGEDPDPIIKALFTKFIPVQITHDPVDDSYTYTGVCEEFAWVKACDIVPEYNCRIDLSTGILSFEEYQSTRQVDGEDYIIKP